MEQEFKQGYRIHRVLSNLNRLDIDDDTERAKREVEAEVVGRYCGLDTSGSEFYLAAWESDDPEVVRERLGRISTTAEKIVEILES